MPGVNVIPNYINDQNLKNDIQGDLSELISISKFCKQRRNKNIAHMDFDFMLDTNNVERLELATKKEIETVIASIQSIYNKIEV
ncbi:MAG: hypothetical protein WCZ43_06165 [Proteiniphilum sp.]